MNIREALYKNLEPLSGMERRYIGGFKGSGCAALCACLEGPLLLVAENERGAGILKNDILFYQQFFSREAVEVLPCPDDIHLIGRRSSVLYRQASIKKIVSFPDAVLFPAAFPDELAGSVLSLKKGIAMERDGLYSSLKSLGYREVSMVAQEGDFCARNWVTDVYPSTEKNPVRIEFFGEEVESLRRFHIDTQRSVGDIDEMLIFPAAQVGSDTAETPFIDIASGTRKCIDLEGVLHASGWDGDVTTLSMISGSEDTGVFRSFSGTGVPHGERSSFESIVDILSNRDDDILVVAPNYHQAKRLSEVFGERGAVAPVLQEGELGSYPGRIAVMVGALSEGLYLEGLMILTQKELFGKEMVLTEKVTESGERFIDNYVDISPEDFVVHADHGIGKFKGLSSHRPIGAAIEVAAIEYAGNSTLYVPLYNIHKIHKYRAEEGFAPPLDTLGGKTWNRRKRKAKRKIDLLVKKLLELYAQRELVKGFAFSPDTELHREFYGFFPYEETADQQKAVEEIFSDMESGSPMDRLLCGDVGFGKTEVAMRAAFKSVYDGRQVAVIVPTTILCEQHYRNFKERFAAFPFTVDYISRFKTTAQLKRTIENIETGKIDIVIGTNALLKRDIRFDNLGLLIIDEEHRFGVSQKEKIIEMKKGVDCLMLSATPIPRTLQIALSGIRRMSVIETPPEERLSVRTTIMRFEDKTIREGVYRELSRGGQIFFVHNRIKDMDKIQSYLQGLLPDVRIASAHGRMKTRELEDIMIGFMNHDSDMLLCTNIVGSGIDIPTANTIFVNMADRYGLADLYQLKGRVGRGNVKADAYFLLKPGRMPTEQGKKRLQAIEQLSYLGAGLKLAMKDLEIRGAGTLFGYQQSGYIHEIGFDMYLDMLKKEVERARGVVVREEPDPELDISVDAFIPDFYVADDIVRLSLYKRLSVMGSEDALADFREEMEDRFGRLPEETMRLLEIVALRISAKKLNIDRLYVDGNNISVSFRHDGPPHADKILRLAEKYRGIQYREDGFELALSGREWSEGMREINNIFMDIAEE